MRIFPLSAVLGRSLDILAFCFDYLIRYVGQRTIAKPTIGA